MFLCELAPSFTLRQLARFTWTSFRIPDEEVSCPLHMARMDSAFTPGAAARLRLAWDGIWGK